VYHVYDGEFNLLSMDDISHTKAKESAIFSNTTLEYSAEEDVQSYVKAVLTDMIFAAKLNGTLRVAQNLAISELKADFWILHLNGFPLAAVEVKKPGLSEDQMSFPYGQLFDYMIRIRSFYGLRCIFGILTDFNTWRICWLPDSNNAAIANQLDYTIKDVDADIYKERQIYASRTYYRENALELAMAMYSLVKKLNYNCSMTEPVPLLSIKRPYIVLKDNSWYWEKGLNATKLSLFMPTSVSDINFIFLLRDFHGGGDGRVWLASNSSGKLMVVKFPSRQDTSEAELARSADAEVSRWHQLGFCSVVRIQVLNRIAIIMPFAFHFHKDTMGNIIIDNSWWINSNPSGMITRLSEYFALALERLPQENPVEVLRECVQSCAGYNLLHEDIDWRHVALFPRINGSLIAGFIDLTRMSSRETVDECVNSMYATISHTLQVTL
jgi:hypothetical protein